MAPNVILAVPGKGGIHFYLNAEHYELYTAQPSRLTMLKQLSSNADKKAGSGRLSCDSIEV